MPIPESVRPLRPFERDCLDLMELEGWAPLFAKVEDLGGWLEVPYTKDGKDLFLLISGTREPQMEELKALASKLDQREFERVVYARELPLSEDVEAPFRRAGVEVLHSELLRSKIQALRMSGNPQSETLPPRIRVLNLTVADFGGIRELSLNFPQAGPVVLTGVNGAGKSTVLEALLVMLAPTDAPGWGEDEHFKLVTDRKVRNGARVARFGVRVEDQVGELFAWDLVLRANGLATVVQSDNADGQATPALPFGEQGGRGVAALERAFVAGYPCDDRAPQSLWRNRRIRHLAEWMLSQKNMENEARLTDPDFRLPQLDAVARAIRSVMGNFEAMGVVDKFGGRRTFRLLEIVLSKRGYEELTSTQLSDGERRMLVIAGDVAKGLVEAHPHLADPLTGAGVVLIDEFELHLHPGWQRTMLVNLEKTFPNIQFILTTHSPQVLSHIPAGNIFLLETREGKISVRQPPGVHGWDSNRILEILMDVPERPPEYKAALNRVSELLDARDLAAARRALDGVRAELGDNDLEVIRLQAVLEFLED